MVHFLIRYIVQRLQELTTHTLKFNKLFGYYNYDYHSYANSENVVLVKHSVGG